ncbi:MAG: DNA translocase FtsK 4TM domain-containing protein, partial [Actinobacteria bacterium]|nr:DNA translocase FtsK 4TM domain-containing protein [Actinomycetota bacterium]
MAAKNTRRNTRSETKLTGKKYETGIAPVPENYVKSRKEVYGIIIILVAILFFISLFVNGESGVVLKYLNYFLSYLFGIGKYIFSLFILTWGISFFIRRSAFLKIRLGLGFLIFLLSLLGLLAVSSEINNIFDEIFIRSRGGITGSGIYYSLFKLTNKAG